MLDSHARCADAEGSKMTWKMGVGLKLKLSEILVPVDTRLW
jgi:hypothetical protein